MNDAGCNGFSSFFGRGRTNQFVSQLWTVAAKPLLNIILLFFFRLPLLPVGKWIVTRVISGKHHHRQSVFLKWAVIIVIIAQSSHILFRLFSSSSFSFQCLRDSLVWWWALLLASSSVADISRGSCEKRLDSISPSFFDWRFFLILSRKFDDSLEPIKTFPQKITRRWDNLYSGECHHHWPPPPPRY